MTKFCLGLFQSPLLSFLFFFSFVALLLYQIRSFQPPFIFLYTTNSSSSSPPSSIDVTGRQPDQSVLLSKLRDSIDFSPLVDLTYVQPPIMQHTWFISKLKDDTLLPNQPKHIYFPSPKSKNRLLCLSAHNYTDGTKNHYALAFPDALPDNSTLLQGLTFVSDTFYIYDNIWHGVQAVAPFVAWHEANGCARPERWALFHRGQLRTREMSDWVRTMAGAALGREVHVEGFEGYEDGPVCFEKAVVCRLNDQGLTVERKREVFDIIRCKAREYCGVLRDGGDRLKIVRMTLLFRVGARAFKNETAVAEIFGSECRKVDGCEFKVAVSNNLTFCDQVKMMTETDIIVTTHGAQLTNMIFMDKNSSILEIFPQGWLEYGGTGQYVLQWLAGWSGMKHQGQWKEPVVDKCPYDKVSDCFYFYKNGKVGHDEPYFSKWIERVLREVKEHKLTSEEFQSRDDQARPLRPCPCS